MNNLHRVVWTKGMFLTPQHFQSQDDYFEDTLQFRFGAAQFANWGVTDLAINEESLANGLLTLRYCRGVLPDGLAFSMPEADELVSGRSVKEFFPPTRRTLDVFLAIPEARTRHRNFTVLSEDQPHAPVSTRYIAETRMMPDATDGEDEKPVQFAGRSFRLLFEGESREGLVTMRIAQLARNDAGAYILNPHFVAPCLNFGSSEYLMMLVRRQIEILSTKSSSLGVPRRQKGRGLADFSSSEIANFWLLHTVNSCLPELKHVWKVRRGHPEGLFVAMLRLAGALSTFSLERDVGDLPDYDHDNLGPCFTALDARVRDLLETVIPSKCVPVPLEPIEPLIWGGGIPDDRFLKNSQFLISVSAKMGVDELIAKFLKFAKVSSASEIHRLVRNSLPGVTLRHVPIPPSAVPVKLDNQYFSLSQNDPLWEGIAASRGLNVFVPGDIADPRMELLIILE
jgi:type VI secretion system protein ImpJ